MSRFNLPIKLLNDKATIPTQGSPDAAGYDLYAAEDQDIFIPPHDKIQIHTGIAMAIPEGYFGAIYARSGIADKRGLRPSNCTGIIDSDYRGEIIVSLHNDKETTQAIKKNERIAQIIFEKYHDAHFMVVDKLDETSRGDGGFGSTGAL